MLQCWQLQAWTVPLDQTTCLDKRNGRFDRQTLSGLDAVTLLWAILTAGVPTLTELTLDLTAFRLTGRTLHLRDWQIRRLYFDTCGEVFWGVVLEIWPGLPRTRRGDWRDVQTNWCPTYTCRPTGVGLSHTQKPYLNQIHSLWGRAVPMHNTTNALHVTRNDVIRFRSDTTCATVLGTSNQLNAWNWGL